MSHAVHVSELPVDRLEQAWPLVREIAGDVSLDSWRAFARNLLDPSVRGRGILIAQRKRTIRGLVTYEAKDDPLRGRELLLRNPVVLDIAMGEPIAESLLQGCLDVARQVECTSLCLEVSSPMRWIADVWQGRVNGETLPLRIVDAQASCVQPPLDNIVPIVSG